MLDFLPRGILNGLENLLAKWHAVWDARAERGELDARGGVQYHRLTRRWLSRLLVNVGAELERLRQEDDRPPAPGAGVRA